MLTINVRLHKQTASDLNQRLNIKELFKKDLCQLFILFWCHNYEPSRVMVSLDSASADETRTSTKATFLDLVQQRIQQIVAFSHVDSLPV